MQTAQKPSKAFSLLPEREEVPGHVDMLHDLVTAAGFRV